MAKSAKEKLAVDGTAKLAAKSKPSDKHEKKNISIEKATVESPRPSRKRAGEFFDFGDEADRVADDLAADDANASAPKAAKKSKTAKTDVAEKPTKKAGKKGKASKGGPQEEKIVSEDAESSKGKKAGTSDEGFAIDASIDTATMAGGGSEGTKKKRAQSKKVNNAPEDHKDTAENLDKKDSNKKKSVTDAKKPKDKKNQVSKETTGVEETIEDRVVQEDKKKQKAKKADSDKKQDASKVSEVAKAAPEETSEPANNVKKGKTGKDVAVKAKADGTKTSKKASTDAPKKGKTESSKAVKANDKDSVDHKPSGKNAEPKETASKSKLEPSAKKPKVKANANAASEVSKAAPAGGASDVNHVSADGEKETKPSKGKSEAKKPTKVVKEGKPAKKAKVGETAKPKKSTGDGEPAKPKKTPKVKDNKPDIADQAIQPMDLVVEEAALQELSKPETSKGKKRKAPSDVAADTLKSDLLDPLSEHAADESAKKKQKKSRKSLGETLGEIVATGADAVRNSFTGILGGGSGDGKPTITGSSQEQSNGKGKSTDVDAPQPTVNDDVEDEEEDEEDDAPDEATVALLAGFESDSDDVDPPSNAGFQEDSKIPALPNAAATSKKLKAVKAGESDKPGVVYVGRIPHGFYEHEMRTYFSQFGDVNRLRLSRSVKTGRSKHYAFLEFKNEDVAKIVAQTMDNYLMFGHILKCKAVAPGDVHESMWKGANKRFKKVPWDKIEGRKLETPVSREVWKKREEKELKKRAEKNKKMIETVGYAFEGTGLRSVDSVPKKNTTATTEDETSLITTGGEGIASSVIVSEEIKETKLKEGSKGDVQSEKVVARKSGKRAVDEGDEAVIATVKKAKKVKTVAKV